MATLTNPVNKQNIIDRFADYVVADANASISWGTNNKPFSEMPNSYFGGTTSGRSIGINGGSIGGTVVTAATIRSVLETETYNYTNMKNLRARLNVTGGGGNTGSKPTPGIVYDQTAKAHMATGYRSGIGAVNNSNVSTGNTITVGNLQTYFTNLRTAYRARRDDTTTVTIDVCHASCHSSCHGSRGRR